MKQKYVSLFSAIQIGILLMLLVPAPASAQSADTTWVQTFTFDSITTRRAWYNFPSDTTRYRKVLAYYTLKCDPATTADGYDCGEWDYLTYNRVFQHIEMPDTTIIEPWEIGRFITPYGIGLDLGPEGFQWIFDVTDYQGLLTDSVDLLAGNNQELLDLKFAFIEGIPPRDILSVKRIWGSQASYTYNSLVDNSNLAPVATDIDPAAEAFKIKTRITGHGHNTSDPSLPHCCEWSDKLHSLTFDGSDRIDWRIWQSKDQCGLNAVWPQGGTWPYAREGWCPGEKVYDYDFEITDIVSPGSSVMIDYDIEPVPASNPGQGGGNFQMAMHLMAYSAANFTLDASIEDIISPSSWEYYGRMNPICSNAKIRIKNTGSTTLTSLNISYGVKGKTPEVFAWTGSLAFLEEEEVVLPILDNSFWDNGPWKPEQFNVSISDPNGGVDEYDANDALSSWYTLPPSFEGPIMLDYKTNDRPYENELTVKDAAGTVVHHFLPVDQNKIHYDTLDLDPGCYTIEFTDEGEDGLSFWASDQGSGYFWIRDMSFAKLHAFDTDFGSGFTYHFSIGDIVSVPEEELQTRVKVFPNPNDGHFFVEIDGDLKGKINFEIYDIKGQTIRSEELAEFKGYEFKEIDLSQAPAGLYFVRISNESASIVRKIHKR